MTKPLLAKGKTKEYEAVTVQGRHKDDMTAGNGVRHAVISGKGEACNIINSNVFTLLREHAIPTTFQHTNGPTTFMALASVMNPYEVVLRFEADGSALKRDPSFKKGQRFDTEVVEFYLKSSGKNFRGIDLPDDDMFISRYDETGIWINRPDRPVVEEESIFISAKVIYGEGMEPHNFDRMEDGIRHVGLVLYLAWQRQDCRLIDFKLEFDDEYRVSDVITPDEWRLLDIDGSPLSKQPFRDGASVEEMQAIYDRIARLSALL